MTTKRIQSCIIWESSPVQQFDLISTWEVGTCIQGESDRLAFVSISSQINCWYVLRNQCECDHLNSVLHYKLRLKVLLKSVLIILLAASGNIRQLYCLQGDWVGDHLLQRNCLPGDRAGENLKVIELFSSASCRGRKRKSVSISPRGI